MTMSDPKRPLSLIAPPYRSLRPLTSGRKQLWREGRTPGSGLVWRMAFGKAATDALLPESRPGGLALIMILPPVRSITEPSELSALIARCRPCAILPHHDVLSVDELAHILRRPPEDLPAEVTDYLAWRGIRIDRDTRHLLRRIIELSTELRSVTALSRSLYVSRRALGRRLLSRGLPVASHWLQFARLLRVAVRLQNTEESVLTAAYALGYPDGFSVSNQMLRLVGYRPGDVRRFWGWEWILEAWLRREADAGGLSPENWAPARAAEDPPSTSRARRPHREPRDADAREAAS